MSDTHNHTNTEKSEVACREEEVLAFWSEHDIFNKSLKKDAPEGDFVFYDGPPFATGLPHYGHLLAGTIKDAIPRFWTMNGKRVIRKWGWDCHGLPLENIIEKRLGLATKRDIEELGVKQFNEAARSTVLEYADEWKKIVPRMGRWVDMEDDFKTMDPTYTETVWWVFSELNRKGLVYEGFKSMHLCPRCGTTLSNFEVNQGYKDIKDIAVTVRLPLLDQDGNKTDTSLLVWTTTPWTLPGNMAAAVHEDADYVKVTGKHLETGKIESFILALKRWQYLMSFENYPINQFRTDVPGFAGEYELVEESQPFKGKELVGKSYEAPFDYMENNDKKTKLKPMRDFEEAERQYKKAWKIYHADYVDVEGEGTGAVHLAPAYGEDDLVLAEKYGIPIVHHVGEDGRFKEFVYDFPGLLAKPKDDDAAGVTHLDADIEILKKLQEDGKLFRKENITHSYPHCWRCDTPLLNYATTSWFVKVTDIKGALVEENSKVHWVPEHVGRSRFGRWLEGARDWAVSRQRYWGAPLPIWRNLETKEYKVFGSLKELQEYVSKSDNKYLLMRHGESESNLNVQISSNKNNGDPLTERGKKQAEDATKGLPKDVDVIIHSGFMRTKMTAEIIAEKLGVSEVIEDERIGEIQMPNSFEGKTWDEYNVQYPLWEDRFTKHIEGFENRRDVQRRAGAFLYDLETKYKNKKILIVAHGCVMFGINCAARGLNLEEAKRLHDAKENVYFGNTEVRELLFVPMPHNDNFELDYHRPYIDDIELYEGDTKLERVPDVFDCWFESGAMPYGPQHYPFENTDVFEPKENRGYPADFIAEGLDQTRGWFYSLIVLGTALFGKSPYRNVITNGLVLAEDGKKMSKSLQNYPDPMELVGRQGADSMRFYLLSSPIIKGEDLNFSEKEVQELGRKNIGRLHNVLLMYETYTHDGVKAHLDSKHVLDRWIIARANELVGEVTKGFESYELDRATRPVTDFIDDLSVWYLRRSRDRLKGDDGEDKEATLSTLRHVLKTLALVMAPSMPFYAEYLFQRVKEKDDTESVHLMGWPEAKEGKTDRNVIPTMATVRERISEALERRAQAGIKVRQPLSTLKVNVQLNDEYVELIKDEINVKEVITDESIPFVELDTEITPELKAEGDAREFIRQVQDMRKKAGLEPRDRIKLAVRTSEGGEEVLRMFEDTVKRVTGADTLTFDCTDGEELTIGEHSFTVSLKKI